MSGNFAQVMRCAVAVLVLVGFAMLLVYAAGRSPPQKPIVRISEAVE